MDLSPKGPHSMTKPNHGGDRKRKSQAFLSWKKDQRKEKGRHDKICIPGHSYIGCNTKNSSTELRGF